MDTPTAVDIITGSINFLVEKYKCHIFGYVIMPNHFHFIIYFPAENRLSDFMRDFKKFTSVRLRQEIENSGSGELLQMLRYEFREQKFKVWMDRFDDVVITNAELLRTKLDYIHHNPLQDHWRLADIPENYPYSSAGFYEQKDSGIIQLTNYIEFVW